MSESPRRASSPALDREIAALIGDEYSSRLRLRPVSVGDARVSVEMPFDPSIVNRSGRVHGGALASLLFAASRVAVAASERTGSERQLRLLTANVAFLSVPHHGRLVAEASVTRRGREIAHTAVDSFDERGVAVANAVIAMGLVDPGAGHVLTPSRPRIGGPREFAAGSRVPSSPYLSAAGVLMLPPEQRTARAWLPQARNSARNPSRVDEGAIAGLADSCAAYAAHLCEPQVGKNGGVTVTMGLAFHSIRDEDLIGAGVVTGHAAGCYMAVVDVEGATSGVSVASGFVAYRLPA